MNEYNKNIPDSISNEELSNVSGGALRKSNPFYESGDTPRYQVGQVVKEKYYIKAINKNKSGIIMKEFTYLVVDARNHNKVIDKKMFESELMIKEGYWADDPFNLEGI